MAKKGKEKLTEDVTIGAYQPDQVTGRGRPTRVVDPVAEKQKDKERKAKEKKEAADKRRKDKEDRRAERKRTGADKALVKKIAALTLVGLVVASTISTAVFTGIGAFQKKEDVIVNVGGNSEQNQTPDNTPDYVIPGDDKDNQQTQQPPVVEALYELTEDEQKAIAGQVYVGRRANTAYDPLSITLAGVTQDTAASTTTAYITVDENGKSVLYALGYNGLIEDENISTSTFDSSEKYLEIGNYITDVAQKDQVVDFLGSQAQMTAVDGAYVKVQTKDLDSNYTATLSSILLDAEGAKQLDITDAGRKYEGLSATEIILDFAGVDNTHSTVATTSIERAR